MLNTLQPFRHLHPRTLYLAQFLSNPAALCDPTLHFRLQLRRKFVALLLQACELFQFLVALLLDSSQTFLDAHSHTLHLSELLPHAHALALQLAELRLKLLFGRPQLTRFGRLALQLAIQLAEFLLQLMLRLAGSFLLVSELFLQVPFLIRQLFLKFALLRLELFQLGLGNSKRQRLALPRLRLPFRLVFGLRGELLLKIRFHLLQGDEFLGQFALLLEKARQGPFRHFPLLAGHSEDLFKLFVLPTQSGHFSTHLRRDHRRGSSLFCRIPIQFELFALLAKRDFHFLRDALCIFHASAGLLSPGPVSSPGNPSIGRAQQRSRHHQQQAVETVIDEKIGECVHLVQ